MGNLEPSNELESIAGPPPCRMGKCLPLHTGATFGVKVGGSQSGYLLPLPRSVCPQDASQGSWLSKEPTVKSETTQQGFMLCL